MPVYEFLCMNCNTIYKFLSRKVNIEKTPDCPQCKKPEMRRMVSLFSLSSGRGKEGDSDADLPGFDESKMEKAMSMLANEGDLDDEDPRKAARLMRKLSDATGLNMGPKMEEALSRLERGEDPEGLEEELGDIMEDEEPFAFGPKGKRIGKKPLPSVDETLYEM
jgi:putative FmdB family regulatory protein